jgi:hypothetical protein
MGTFQRVAGADFSAVAGGFIPPIAEGLKYWNFFGGDAAKSARNLAPGGAAAALVNSPAISPSYVSLGGASQSGAAYIETGVAETAALTYLLVSRATADMAVQGNRPMLIGNYNFAASPKGAALYDVVATIIRADAAYTDGATISSATTDINVTSGQLAAWNFKAASFGNATPRKVYNKTLGASATSGAETRQRSLNTAATIRVGTSLSGLFGPNDQAFAAVYNRQLTDAEIETIYQFVKTYLAARSITI